MNTTHPPNSAPRPVVPPGAPLARLTGVSENGPVTRETTQPVLLVGSRRDCHLPIAHPDVSKVHCAVVNTGRAVLVCDLLSRTGTFINQQAIRVAVLKPGDTLRVGPAEVQVAFANLGVGEAISEDQALLALGSSLAFDTGAGRLELKPSLAVIGRRAGADVLIDDPDVSLAHALVLAVDGRPAICDLGSRSGTFLNGERIELAWIADGDELRIGGECLIVRWAAPRTAVAGKVGEFEGSVRPQATQAPSSGADIPPALADLADLERTIAAVQAQITSARGRMDERQLELEQREAALREQQEQLEPRRAALEQAEADVRAREQVVSAAQAQLAGQQAALAQRQSELTAQAAELERQRRDLESQRAAAGTELARALEARKVVEEQQRCLGEAREACERKERELQQRSVELDAAVAQLSQEREQLAAERRLLEEEVAAQARASAEVERRAEEFSAREAAVATRERELALREAALRDREAQEGEAFAKIEQFKSVLQKASSVFASSAPNELAAGQLPTATVGRAPEAKAGLPPAEAAGGGDALPAPMVDQPIFDPGAAGPPADWPAELRERYRVLRRVSPKSNEELLAQVWAERDRISAGPAAEPPARKRRFRWGN